MCRVVASGLICRIEPHTATCDSTRRPTFVMSPSHDRQQRDRALSTPPPPPDPPTPLDANIFDPCHRRQSTSRARRLAVTAASSWATHALRRRRRRQGLGQKGFLQLTLSLRVIRMSHQILLSDRAVLPEFGCQSPVLPRQEDLGTWEWVRLS